MEFGSLFPEILTEILFTTRNGLPLTVYKEEIHGVGTLQKKYLLRTQKETLEPKT